jgi:hypothetical protein
VIVTLSCCSQVLLAQVLVSNYFQNARIKSIDVAVLTTEGPVRRLRNVFRYERPREQGDARQDFLMTGEGKFLSIETPYVRVTIGTEESESS